MRNTILCVLFSGFLISCNSNLDNKNMFEVTISGSTNVAPLVEEIAKEYKVKNPENNVLVQSAGSSQGIKALLDGIVPLAMSSRELTEQENTLIDKNLIAYNGIAIIVHPENKINNLSSKQIKNIFEGKITNWKEVGGIDSEILVITREEGSGTRTSFMENLNIEFIVDTALQNEGNGAVKSNLSTKINSIAYVAIPYLDNLVKAINIDEIQPTKENIKNNTYKVKNPLYLLTKKDLKTTDSSYNIIESFYDFIISEDGQKIINEKYTSPK